MKIVSKRLDANWKTSQHNQERERRNSLTPGWIKNLQDAGYKVGDLVYVNTSPDKVNYHSVPTFPGWVTEVPETGMSLKVEFELEPGGPKVEMLYPVWKLRGCSEGEYYEPHMNNVVASKTPTKPKKEPGQ